MLIRVPFGQFLEGHGKVLPNTLIRALFRQFLEGHGKVLPSTFIRASFRQFLEGHGKGLQGIVIKPHFSIKSKSGQLLLFGKIFSTDRKKFFRWPENFFPNSSSYLNDFVYKRTNHIWFRTNFSVHGKNRKCAEKFFFHGRLIFSSNFSKKLNLIFSKY